MFPKCKLCGGDSTYPYAVYRTEKKELLEVAVDETHDGFEIKLCRACVRRITIDFLGKGIGL